METFPKELLYHLISYLNTKDAASLAQTCHYLRAHLPRFHVMRGQDFVCLGPDDGNTAPEHYFDGKPLESTVRRLSISMEWEDQGFGNRKGRLYIKLMRPRSGSHNAAVMAEKHDLFDRAEHSTVKVNCIMTDDPVLTLAQPGDFYRFMRDAGGGGGHKLSVRSFIAVAMLD